MRKPRSYRTGDWGFLSADKPDRAQFNVGPFRTMREATVRSCPAAPTPLRILVSLVVHRQGILCLYTSIRKRGADRAVGGGAAWGSESLRNPRRLPVAGFQHSPRACCRTVAPWFEPVTTTALLPASETWCQIFWSADTMIEKPASSAAASSLPFASQSQPISYAVLTW